MTMPLLKTKLYIPLPRPELVPRPRLIERLDGETPRSVRTVEGVVYNVDVSEYIRARGY